MRFLSTLLLACSVAAPALAQDGDSISSSMLSRCAGKAGTDTRQSDAAFGIIALDGVPWLTIERTEDMVGTQPIVTTVTGTGTQQRRNGTIVPFRFTCVLDAKGQALMVHASRLMVHLGDELPPSIIVGGSATYLEKTTLPKGVELRVQLRDIEKTPAGEIIAEQVVRSGWQVPIPFALRLPKDTSTSDRKLVMTAQLVLAHQTLFQLKEPRTIVIDNSRKPVELTLDKVEATRR